MKISIIIPIYNRGQYLARVFKCLFDQTHKDLEIICVNDGSPDNSLAILREYAANDNRIKILDQDNLGVAMARNNGITAATGDYVHFFDPDDEIDSDYYEKMANVAIKTDSDVVASGFEEEGKRTIIYKSIKTYETIGEKFAGTMAIFRGFCWRYLIRREFILKKDLKFPNIIVLEDLLFVLEMIRLANRVATVPGPLYKYRIDMDSCLRTTDSIRVKIRNRQFATANEKVHRFVKKYGLQKYRLHWWNKLPLGLANRKKIVID